MLSQMREASQSWLIYVAFGILIVVFVFYFGPQTEGCQPSKRQTAAVVNGTEIDNTDLTILLNRVSRRNQRLDDAEYIRLQKQTLEKLALLYLLADEAQANGLAVGPDQLSAFILDGRRNADYTYYSNKDGKFDRESYQRFVQYGLEVTVEQYEAFKTRELLARDYLTVLEQTLLIPPSQVESATKLQNTKVELEFIKVDPKQLESAIEFTDAEVSDYASKNAEAIEKFYTDNKKDYEKPKRARVRRLMVKKPSDSAADEAKKEAEQKWTDAKARVIEKKEDFEAVVKEISEDIAYKDKGGDMGWSKLEDMNQEMAKVVNDMKQGDVKEYSSTFANFLLKLEEVEEAKASSLDEVRNDIARQLLTEQEAQKRIEAMANKLLAAAKGSPAKPLAEVLTAAKPAQAPAAPAEEGTEGQDGTEGEKEEATQKETPWDKLTVATTGAFARAPRQSFKFDQETKKIVPTSLPWSDIPRIGQDKNLAMAAFDKLTAEAPVYGELYKSDKDGSLFVIRLKERTEPKKEDEVKNASQTRAQLSGELRGDWLGAWQLIVYNPTVELEEVSPWLARYWEDAKRTGKVEIDGEAFGDIEETTTKAVEKQSNPPVEEKKEEGTAEKQ